MIKAIIFDIGGVISTGKIELLLEKISEKLKINKDDLLTFFKAHKPELATGKMKFAQFHKLLKQKFNLKEDILLLWKKTYLDVFSLNPELLDYADSLRERYKTGVITNTIDFHSEINRERGLFKHFDETITSSDFGAAKPSREVFDEMLKRFNLKSEECVLIEDRLEHLEIPRQMGFNIIHFKNNNQFFKEIKKIIK